MKFPFLQMEKGGEGKREERGSEVPFACDKLGDNRITGWRQ